MRTRLAIILVAVLCLSAGGPAYAEWVSLGDNGHMTVYVDPGTIRRNGNLVKMWTLLDFNTARTLPSGISYLSSKTQEEFDCAEESRRNLSLTNYSNNMGRGDVVITDSGEGKWVPIAPGTISQNLWKFACGKK